MNKSELRQIIKEEIRSSLKYGIGEDIYDEYGDTSEDLRAHLEELGSSFTQISNNM